ncbi:MAG: putative ABC transporter permease [Bacilli bacterium]
MNYGKKFAKGLCFDKLVLIFAIGCIFGAYYEEILTFIKTFIKTGELIWVHRRGVLYGPFSPIYGAGILLLTNFLVEKNFSKKKVFILVALLGGFFEYIVSYLQESFIGTISWDYSNKFLNLNGRTTIPFMIFWGLCGVFYIFNIYPKLSYLIEKIPIKLGKFITMTVFIFLTFNMLISFTALGRQALRKNGVKPYTIIGRIYDKIYTDEYLSRKFPNMVRKRSNV